MPTKNLNKKQTITENNLEQEINEKEQDTNGMLAIIEQLKADLEKLTASQNNPINQVQYVGVSKMDKLCTLIHLCECHPGLPTTIKINNREIRFTKFGEKRTFRFSDMEEITSRYRDWFERGVFTLGEDCDEFKDDFGVSFMKIPMPVSKHKMIATLPFDEFQSIVNDLSLNQSIYLAKTWMDRFNKQIPGYDNIEKIRILNKKTNGFMKDFLNELLNEDI